MHQRKTRQGDRQGDRGSKQGEKNAGDQTFANEPELRCKCKRRYSISVIQYDQEIIRK